MSAFKTSRQKMTTIVMDDAYKGLTDEQVAVELMLKGTPATPGQVEAARRLAKEQKEQGPDA